jgi:carboxypeptidase C (cathepsin A)
MTWGGVQGFQTPINQSNFVVPGFGPAAGNMHTERKLTYVEVVLSGHMVPQFSPWASGFRSFLSQEANEYLQSALQIMQYLLGQRASLSG